MMKDNTMTRNDEPAAPLRRLRHMWVAVAVACAAAYGDEPANQADGQSAVSVVRELKPLKTPADEMRAKATELSEVEKRVRDLKGQLDATEDATLKALNAYEANKSEQNRALLDRAVADNTAQVKALSGQMAAAYAKALGILDGMLGMWEGSRAELESKRTELQANAKEVAQGRDEALDSLLALEPQLAEKGWLAPDADVPAEVVAKCNELFLRCLELDQDFQDDEGLAEQLGATVTQLEAGAKAFRALKAQTATAKLGAEYVGRRAERLLQRMVVLRSSEDLTRSFNGTVAFLQSYGNLTANGALENQLMPFAKLLPGPSTNAMRQLPSGAGVAMQLNDLFRKAKERKSPRTAKANEQATQTK
jgi:hypothetical protein